MFHKINSVSPLTDYRLCVHFWDGTTKMYDMGRAFERWPQFLRLKGPCGEFDEVRVDVGGYGVIWDDELDLDCEELWENGERVRTSFDDILSFADASKIWKLNESTLRKAVSYGKFTRGVDVCKYGKQWLISRDAMCREYGRPGVKQMR